ncbi:MAG TPA: hypothetical protein PLA65_02780 [Spirochaetota bacterium]|nr:hypothetical protein [Spirochaetota bacterium]
MTSGGKRRIVLGSAAWAFYAVHAAALLYLGEWWGMFWGCHVASILIGFGLLLERPALNAAGVMRLVLGDFMWVLYLAGGGDLYPTSILTHVCALLVGLLGVRMMGVPRHAWALALSMMLALAAITRLATPARENVNLAFRVHEGWEGIFPSYPLYVLMLLSLTAALFIVTGKLLRAARSRLAAVPSGETGE